MSELIGDHLNTEDIDKELDMATKAQRQALGVQRKLENELDNLDVTDKYYDRKFESLNRRLEDAFEAIEKAEKSIADCEARLESVRRQKLSKESIYESLKLFDKLYDKMNDYEKKALSIRLSKASNFIRTRKERMYAP